MERSMIFGAAHRRRSSFPSGNGGSEKGRCRCGLKKRPLSLPVGVKIVVNVIPLKNPLFAKIRDEENH